MSEIFVINEVHRLIFDRDREKDPMTRRRESLSRSRRTSLGALEEFKEFVEKMGLNPTEINKSFDDQEKSFYNFIINARIRKELRYQLHVKIKDYHYIVLPECPQNFIYKNMILFKTSLEDLETSMIKFVNDIKKNEAFDYVDFGRSISLYLEIKSGNKIVEDFLKMFKLDDENIYRVNIDFENYRSKDVKILTSDGTNYISLGGSPTDLEFLIFAKEYFSKFIG